MSPFRKWYRSLDSQASTKIDTVLAKLELGIHSRIKWFRGIGEYVLDWGPCYRIYLLLDGDRVIVLLGGGTKKSQQSDINQALDHYREFKARRAK
jgi:putative addiction module killer protein